MKEKQKIVLNKMSNNDSLYVSKPPKIEGKQGSVYVIWSIKFRSWAGVKRIRRTLAPSFDGKLPATKKPYWMTLIPHSRHKGLPSSKMP